MQRQARPDPPSGRSDFAVQRFAAGSVQNAWLVPGPKAAFHDRSFKFELKFWKKLS
jgi:hypothetical protein